MKRESDTVASRTDTLLAAIRKSRVGLRNWSKANRFSDYEYEGQLELVNWLNNQIDLMGMSGRIDSDTLAEMLADFFAFTCPDGRFKSPPLRRYYQRAPFLSASADASFNDDPIERQRPIDAARVVMIQAVQNRREAWLDRLETPGFSRPAERRNATALQLEEAALSLIHSADPLCRDEDPILSYAYSTVVAAEDVIDPAAAPLVRLGQGEYARDYTPGRARRLN